LAYFLFEKILDKSVFFLGVQFLSKLGSFLGGKFSNFLPQKIGGNKRVLGANMILFYFFSKKSVEVNNDHITKKP
jgi:hypothetical protein